MNTEILDALNKVDLRDASQEVEGFITIYASMLPVDYLSFIRKFDGGVGFIGDDDYLDLWSIENVVKLNPYLKNDEFSNNVVIIGSNGSGTLYGFSVTRGFFFKVDEYEMNDNSIANCGETFLSFLKYLELGQGG